LFVPVSLHIITGIPAAVRWRIMITVIQAAVTPVAPVWNDRIFALRG